MPLHPGLVLAGRCPEELIDFCPVIPQDPDAVEQLNYCVETPRRRGPKAEPISRTTPFTTPRATMDALHAVNRMAEDRTCRASREKPSRR